MNAISSTKNPASPHSCLSISRIITLICAALYFDRPSSAGIETDSYLKDLTAMAATCRAFATPANNFLWSEMDSLVPFFKCLPDDLWAIVEKRGSPQLVFRRPVLPSDVDKFLEKSCLLRKLIMEDGRRHGLALPIISLQAWQSLDTASRNLKLLFPNLTSLHSGNKRHELAIIFRHIGTNLSQLHQGDAENHQLVVSELSTEHYPGFGRQSVDRPPPASSLCECIRRWPGLRSLKTDWELTPETLLHLMVLPHLRSLSIRFSSPMPTIPSKTLADQHVFRALQSLSFLCDNAEIATELLRLLQNSKLVKASISFYRQLTDWDEWDTLIQVLPTSVSHSSLQSVSFHDYTKMTPIEEFEFELLAFKSLRPLFAFSRLKTLILFVAQGINFDDAKMDELTRALPYLEQLSFDHAATLAYRPNATLTSISSIAARCPNIKVIQLTVDATRLDAILRPVVAKNGPVSLHFGYSPIRKRDASSVASILRGVFSHISVLHGFYVPTHDIDPSFDPDDDSPWFKVGRLTMHENLRVRRGY